MYGLALNMIPLSVHKLACTCGFILLTDWLLYTTDINKKHLSVTSYRMSQCRLDGDKQILNSVSITIRYIYSFIIYNTNEI